MACSKPLTQEDIDKVAFFLEVLARELREGTARLLEYIPESRPADIRLMRQDSNILKFPIRR